MQTRARARAVARIQGELGIEWIEFSSDRFVRAIGCSSPVVQIFMEMMNIYIRKLGTLFV